MNEFSQANWRFYLLPIDPSGFGWYAKISDMLCLDDIEVLCKLAFDSQSDVIRSIATFIKENNIQHWEVTF